MNSETIHIGLSPCPNDTFIFDALLHGKTDTEGINFEPVITDVEELNRLAFSDALEVTKVSYHAFMFLTKKYAVLNFGSALGHGCGPLLIARELIPQKEISKKIIAVPGKYTTANFLLSLAFPDAKSKTEMMFSRIEDALLQKRIDCGVIIHENRFTYREKGLVCLLDLGEYWETRTGLPIPLGGIVVKRSLSAELQKKLNRIMGRSVEFAFQNPESSNAFVKSHAQEMNEEVIRSHIALYVNEFSRSLGEAGRNAIQRMFDEAKNAGALPAIDPPEFIFDGYA